MSTDVLIMAAGKGDRFGDDGPKQFAELLEKPMILWSIERFAKNPRIDTITIVTAPGEEKTTQQLVTSSGVKKVDRVVPGGETRQESVRLGLQSLGTDSTRVLVHDTARPCLSDRLVNKILDALDTAEAVVPVVETVDTLVREDGSGIDALLDRVHVSQVQTPQGFHTPTLVRAHKRAMASGLVCSDDGSLVFALPKPVRTIAGDRTNIKVTFPEDVRIAEAILDDR